MLRTKRLILDKPTESDFNRFYEIQSDPQTNLFNPAGPMDLAKAKKVFEEMINQWKGPGYSAWIIREIDNPDQVIGVGGLSDRLYGEEVKLNLGYRFDASSWGKGYATELSFAAIEFGFDQLNTEEIFAIVRPGHLASIKVLEKCEMVLFDKLNDVEGQAESLVYKITKPDYLAKLR